LLCLFAVREPDIIIAEQDVPLLEHIFFIARHFAAMRYYAEPRHDAFAVILLMLTCLLFILLFFSFAILFAIFMRDI
jgi:hypothetical protein